jgi:PAS domain S-box-containing protein
MATRKDTQRAEDGLKRSNELLEAARQQADKLELRVQERTRTLQKRMKELDCLYSISDILNKQGFSREESGRTLERIINLVSPGWQYPEITCTRLSLGDKEYQTHNFSETPWKQSSPIVLQGESVGRLEVFFLEEKPSCDEGPFLREERRLLDSIANQVGQFLEMKESQKHLIEQARILEGFFTATITPLVLLDRDFNFIRVNSAYAKACQRDISDFIGRNHFDLYPSDARGIFEEVVRTKESRQASAKPFAFPDHPEWGVTYWDWTLTPALNPSGEVDFLVFSLNDVTERTRAQEKLRENERLLRTVLENLPLGVWITDGQRRISYVNSAFLKTHGLTPDKVLGARYDDLLHAEPEGDEFREALYETLRRGQTWKGHLVRKVEGGGPLELDLTVSPVREENGGIINYVSVERDVTEEIRLQQHLRQMQKMEALGTLAGGIAHDFNNILMPIAINTELALLDVTHGSLLSNYLQLVLEAANRGKELVKQIITFSRQKEQERKPMDVAPLVKEALKFFRASIPRNIEIRERMEATSSIVPTDPTQIHQILLNLCSNAAYAMREQGGELEVRLTNVEFDSKRAAEHVELRPGPYLRLTVSDTGHGMEKDVMERAFDPFFTTKKTGEGTGMGLAVVHGIVKSHKGMVTVESELGKGTTFHIYLPRMNAELEVAATVPRPILRGNERILFIDDEAVQVQTVQYMLERLGYQVTGQSNAMEALRIFRSQPDAFDLVITDQTMPHITGDKLARELLTLRPDLPVLLCTGFSEAIDEEGAKAIGIKEFLMKPYAVGEITEKIRRALKK